MDGERWIVVGRVYAGQPVLCFGPEFGVRRERME